MQPAIERVVRNIMKKTQDMAKVHRRGEDLRIEVDSLKRDIASKWSLSQLLAWPYCGYSSSTPAYM